MSCMPWSSLKITMMFGKVWSDCAWQAVESNGDSSGNLMQRRNRVVLHVQLPRGLWGMEMSVRGKLGIRVCVVGVSRSCLVDVQVLTIE